MTRLYSIALTILLAVTALALPAQAGKEGPGTRVVRDANQALAKQLRQKVAAGSEAEKRLSAQVTTSLRGFLDVDALGRRALVDHWSNLSPEERKRFQSLLRELIEMNYIKGLRANLEYDVVYTGEKRKGDEIVVATEIKTMRRGRPYAIAIDYVLQQEGGKWRAYDVVTDGVGLVENYRAQFNKIIAKEGFDGLLARMQKMQKKLSQQG